MHPMLKWFSWQHLPAHLQAVSQPLARLAGDMDAALADSPEKTAAMRKLLEAKDCFVRAAIEEKEAEHRRLVDSQRQARGEG